MQRTHPGIPLAPAEWGGPVSLVEADLAVGPGSKKPSQLPPRCSAYPRTCTPGSGKQEWRGQLIKHSSTRNQLPSSSHTSAAPRPSHTSPLIQKGLSTFQCAIWMNLKQHQYSTVPIVKDGDVHTLPHSATSIPALFSYFCVTCALGHLASSDRERLKSRHCACLTSVMTTCG